jgi:alcohol dehydrogenase (NADP+)
VGTGDDKNLFPQDEDGKVIQDRNTDLLSLWKVFNAFKKN